MKRTLRKWSPANQITLKHHVQIIEEEARIAELRAGIPDA